jgi:hypothetical protein
MTGSRLLTKKDARFAKSDDLNTSVVGIDMTRVAPPRRSFRQSFQTPSLFGSTAWLIRPRHWAVGRIDAMNFWNACTDDCGRSVPWTTHSNWCGPGHGKVSDGATIWARVSKSPGNILAFDNLKDHRDGGWLFGDDDWRRRRLVIDVPPDGRRGVLIERNRHGLVCGFYSDVSRRGYTPYREARSEFNLQHVARIPAMQKIGSLRFGRSHLSSASSSSRPLDQ